MMLLAALRGCSWSIVKYIRCVHECIAYHCIHSEKMWHWLIDSIGAYVEWPMPTFELQIYLVSESWLATLVLAKPAWQASSQMIMHAFVLSKQATALSMQVLQL